MEIKAQDKYLSKTTLATEETESTEIQIYLLRLRVELVNGLFGGSAWVWPKSEELAYSLACLMVAEVENELHIVLLSASYCVGAPFMT